MSNTNTALKIIAGLTAVAVVGGLYWWCTRPSDVVTIVKSNTPHDDAGPTVVPCESYYCTVTIVTDISVSMLALDGEPFIGCKFVGDSPIDLYEQMIQYLQSSVIYSGDETNIISAKDLIGGTLIKMYANLNDYKAKLMSDSEFMDLFKTTITDGVTTLMFSRIGTTYVTE